MFFIIRYLKASKGYLKKLLKELSRISINVKKDYYNYITPCAFSHQWPFTGVRVTTTLLTLLLSILADLSNAVV